MNTKEAMQALIDGKKVRPAPWAIHHYIILNKGKIVNQIDIPCAFSINDHDDFELYEEPKKQVEVWLWRYKYASTSDWRIDVRLLSEEDAAKQFLVYDQYERHAGPWMVEE